MPSLIKAMAALVCCLVITIPAKRVMTAELLSLDANDEADQGSTSLSQAVAALDHDDQLFAAMDRDGNQEISEVEFKKFKEMGRSISTFVQQRSAEDKDSNATKASDVAEKTSQENGCSTISKEIRGMWAAGAMNWEGVYKCQHKDGRVVLIQCGMDNVKGVRQAACWVAQTPDEMTQFLNGVTGVITSVTDTIASLVVMPATKAKAHLDAAIAKFSPDQAAKLHLELDDKWDRLNPFEKEFTVSVLASVTTREVSLLELSEVSGESEVADLEGENFFTFLLKLIGALIKGNERNQRRAAANKYMSMNIGWDHVRSNMRRDGWRW